MTVRVRSVQVQVSVYFAALLTFACLLAPDGSAFTGILCCITHEAGHLLCIRLAGGRVRSVHFGVYGMRIVPAPTTCLSHGKEALIAAAGPAVNLLLALSGILLRRTLLARVNFALAAFNLMPVRAADGGSFLYHLLIRRHPAPFAHTALRISGAVFLLLAYALGAAAFLQSGWHPSLTASLAYLSILYFRDGSAK